jgi:two-component system OmpR family sensor kinase
MTLLFTTVTALCLALLGALASQIDHLSRDDQLSSDVSDRAGGLARAAYFDLGALHLEPFSEDELARGASAVAVYRLDTDSRPTQRAFGADTSGDITINQLHRVVGRVVDEQGLVTQTLQSSSGSTMVWAVAPVWDGDVIGAVVLVGQDDAAQSAAHDRLVAGLITGSLALLVVSGAAGHLVSGRAMRSAMRSLSAQEQFLTEAAHEIRTPLTTLRLEIESREPEGSEQFLHSIDRLDHLVTALLTRARIDGGTFEPERVRLRLDQLVETVAAEYGDAIVLTEPAVVIGDPVLLGQAVRNLIDNARRYAPGTIPRVTASPGLVTVDDSGPGIPSRDRYRALETGAGAGLGTGSGLAIVSWITELHHGSLELCDAPGGGLRVQLRIPPAP